LVALPMRGQREAQPTPSAPCRKKVPPSLLRLHRSRTTVLWRITGSRDGPWWVPTLHESDTTGGRVCPGTSSAVRRA